MSYLNCVVIIPDSRPSSSKARYLDWRRVFAIFLWIFLLSPVLPAHAQLSTKVLGTASGAETSQKLSNPIAGDEDDMLEAITRKLNDAQIRQQEVLTALAAKNPPSYASFDELKERQIQLFTTKLALESWLNALAGLKKAEQAESDLEGKIQSWSGFGIDEPYPLGLIDKLAAELRAKKLELETEEARTRMEEDLISGFRKALELAGPKVRKAAEALERAREKNEARMRWLLEAAEVEQAMAEAQFQSALIKVELNKRLVSLLAREIDFFKEQLEQTRGKTEFSRNDLDKRLKVITTERDRLKKHLIEAERQNDQAKDKLTKARNDLERALADEGQDHARLRQLFELSQVEADTTSQRVETLKLLLATNSLETILWQERFRVYQGFDKNQDLADTIQNLDTWQERVSEFKDYYNSKSRLTRTQIQIQDKTLEGLPAGTPGKQIEQAKQDAYQERMADLDQLIDSTELVSFLTTRLREETNVARQERSFFDRFQISLTSYLGVLSAIWNYEIFSVEDTIVADGRVISGSRPVTLKKVVYGLLLLTVGIWLVIKASKLLSQLAQKRLKTERSLVLLFEKIGQFIAIFIVIVAALGLVQIPFTAFAFLGGALAIAVGFGGQNLINNFMSSLILLIEKPIKVGDVVEAEGVLGRVTAIGGRCSTIQRFDGVDMLVPNSHLLEQTVVNRTLSDNLVRYDLKVGVAYGSPVRDVFRLLEQVADENGLVLKNPKPVVLLEDFAADALLFGIYYWVEVNERLDVRVVASDLRHRIDRVFRDAGISIAFPQRDVHLDAEKPLRIQLQAEKQPNDELAGNTPLPHI